MNRKECEKALEMLKEYAMEIVEDESLDGEIFYEWYQLNEEELRQYTAPLETLMKEHFDNPPLKFDELKVGMWIYDSKTKRMMKIYDISYSDKSFNVNGEFFDSGLHLKEFLFEENRFYRKQVEEC